MEILYVVTYNGSLDPNRTETTIEAITDSPDDWLEHHNKVRQSTGEQPELKEEFDFKQVAVFRYEQ